ncbi:glycosyltransferase family 4 protein [Burkholderia multivorans]|uniref:glycosyltransferase family 4 protein n=1 Tax=Burkholderia multivorans TaxID=87883 RepID=UPI001C227EA1|nr:glycosyltransferase family 4 protein [Burkholderia multivorans]MBU9605470.1 glycosyltransferase family 4 protein [Burkholderia multivorans]MBU9627463.1 glycosyltransferase family 4 protein [Burkholderia multivorans]
MRLINIKRLMGQLPSDEAGNSDVSDYTMIEQSGLFDRDWYLAVNADVAANGIDPLTHYLDHGWAEGRNPSLQFDGARYMTQYPDARDFRGGPLVHYLRVGRANGHAVEAVSPCLPEPVVDEPSLDDACREIDASGLFDRDAYLCANPDVAAKGLDPVRHYAEIGWREGRQPSAFFDAAWYLQHNPDVAQASVDPLLHYIRAGQGEGRMPNPFFDAEWYEGFVAQTGEAGGRSPYAMFASRGVDAGHSPLPELQALYALRSDVPEDALGQYKRLVAAARPWWDRYGRGKFVILAALFSPNYDHANGTVGSDDPVERLITFLRSAQEMEIDPGPLFCAQYYKRAARNRGCAFEDGETALQHFLRVGFDRRIVPTGCFDEKYYYEKYPDIRDIWVFEHFIRWGVFEGRRASRRPRPVVVQLPAPTTDQQARLNNWKYFLATCGRDGQFGDMFRGVPRHSEVIDGIIHSAVFAETMRRVSLIEPAVGDVSEIDEVLVPPYHDGRNLARKALRALLERDHYDTVVCVPWIRTGGADLVACQICDAMRIARPSESVLLIRTDQPNFDRPEWIPSGVDVIDASGVFRSIPPADAQMLLYGLFMGLAPSRVINVNSRLCWDTMARFGERLSDSINLYSYLFCWDQTASGYRVGYPSEFFPETANNLRAVFTDTVYLKNELTRIYNVPSPLVDRIVPLFSPSRGIVEGPTKAEESVDGVKGRRRWKILWAGRLDRQKRFDLVQDIARRMPDVDFLCWGSALLDAPPDHSRSPDNLILNDGFSSYDELPLAEADLWLFTSEWEGMPTILIELAHRGMPIVASSVGGVPELIDEETGWPVDDVRSIDAYIAVIRNALASPRERVARAQRLRERARIRHSMPAYVEQISEILNKEVGA